MLNIMFSHLVSSHLSKNSNIYYKVKLNTHFTFGIIRTNFVKLSNIKYFSSVNSQHVLWSHKYRNYLISTQQSRVSTSCSWKINNHLRSNLLFVFFFFRISEIFGENIQQLEIFLIDQALNTENKQRFLEIYYTLLLQTISKDKMVTIKIIKMMTTRNYRRLLLKYFCGCLLPTCL